MVYKNKKAFTLVELIVVITLLAILWTIAFISLQGYGKDSRNTVRTTDTKLIKKALWIYIATNSKYPDPDDFTNVTYSGSTLWKQWTFWNNAFVKLKSLSNIPVDLIFKNEYDYSVLNNWHKFELATVMEWWLTSNINNNILNKANALSNNDVVSYVSWDYDYMDIKVSTGSNCYNISAPSLVINNIWADWVLSLSSYKFVYHWGVNIPTSYSWSIDTPATWLDFLVSEIYNKCSIDTLDDLELYSLNLSTAYLQLDWVSKYEDAIYNSQTVSYKLNSLNKLKDDWIIIANSVKAELEAKAPDNLFTDSFSWSNNDNIIIDHWFWGSTKSPSDYTIENNELYRNTWSSEIIFPSPPVAISYSDSKASFVVKNISGDIKVYAKYIDTDNYYMLIINPSFYEIWQNVWTSLYRLAHISDWISNGDKIDFNVTNNVLQFLINDVEKDRVVASSITGNWKPWIEITSWWDAIDDYVLYYK